MSLVAWWKIYKKGEMLSFRQVSLMKESATRILSLHSVRRGEVLLTCSHRRSFSDMTPQANTHGDKIATSRGRRRSTKRHFLPFDEARDYVRNLGFKKRGEYETFWKRERPDFLPCRPDLTSIYSPYWTNFPDFCGYKPRRRMVDPRPIPQDYCKRFSHRQEAHSRGVFWFDELVSKFAPDFEFEFFGRVLGANIYCRKKGSTTDKWILLSVRHAEKPFRASSFCFRLSGANIGFTSWLLICQEEQRIYMIPTDDVSESRTLTVTPAGKYDKYLVEPERIGEILGHWWSSPDVKKVSQSVTLSQSVWASMVLQAKHLCYDPAVLSFCSKPSLSVSGYNSLVNKARIMHRCGMERKKGGAQGQLFSLHRQVAGQYTCHIIDDNKKETADFYSILLHENRVLKKMMLFPKAILLDIIGSEDGRYAHGHRVYPSYSSPRTKQSREKQKKQLPYEIDLRKPLHSGPEREKLLRILQGELG